MYELKKKMDMCYTAKEIRDFQYNLKEGVEKEVKKLTDEIYNTVKNNPDEKVLRKGYPIGEVTKQRLEELGYKVEIYAVGIYADTWWTSITWDED